MCPYDTFILSVSEHLSLVYYMSKMVINNWTLFQIKQFITHKVELSIKKKIINVNRQCGLYVWVEVKMQGFKETLYILIDYINIRDGGNDDRGKFLLIVLRTVKD